MIILRNSSIYNGYSIGDVVVYTSKCDEGIVNEIFIDSDINVEYCIYDDNLTKRVPSQVMLLMTEVGKKYLEKNPETGIDICNIATVNLTYANIEVVIDAVSNIPNHIYVVIDKSIINMLDSLKINYNTKTSITPELVNSDKLMIKSLQEISDALTVRVSGKDTCKYIIICQNIGVISVYPIGTVCKRNIVYNGVDIDDDKDIFTIIGIYIGYKGSVRYAVQPRYGDAVILPENALVFD